MMNSNPIMQRTKTVFAALALISGLATQTYAQSPTRLPNAAIGSQVLGRVQVNADFSVNIYGYFSFLQGVTGPIFSGPPSESTAMFTFSPRLSFRTAI
jgi:hypothetical protein